MKKQTRYTVAVTVRLKPDQAARLQALVESENEPATEILRRAIERELDRCRA